MFTLILNILLIITCIIITVINIINIIIFILISIDNITVIFILSSPLPSSSSTPCFKYHSHHLHHPHPQEMWWLTRLLIAEAAVLGSSLTFLTMIFETPEAKNPPKINERTSMTSLCYNKHLFFALLFTPLTTLLPPLRPVKSGAE